jgi:hypothetical protein
MLRKSENVKNVFSCSFITNLTSVKDNLKIYNKLMFFKTLPKRTRKMYLLLCGCRKTTGSAPSSSVLTPAAATAWRTDRRQKDPRAETDRLVQHSRYPSEKLNFCALQYCLNGRCVAEHENIIPDYTQNTPSYIRSGNPQGRPL